MGDAAGRPPSMAELQGLLLRCKDDPAGALALAADAGSALRLAPGPPASGGAGPTDAPPVKSRGRRRLTPDEVDKMVFNPQEGWEDEIGKIK